MKLPIDKIKIPERYTPLDNEHLNVIKEDMKINRLVVPIKIDKNYSLIDGYYRLKAAKELGWNEIEVLIIDIKYKD